MLTLLVDDVVVAPDEVVLVIVGPPDWGSIVNPTKTTTATTTTVRATVVGLIALLCAVTLRLRLVRLFSTDDNVRIGFLSITRQLLMSLERL